MKEKLIKDILEFAKIHHNIRIDFYKSTKAIESAHLTDEQQDSFNRDMQIESDMIEMFKNDFEDWSNNPINDTGNRNAVK